MLQPLEGFLDLRGYADGFWNLCPPCHAPLFRADIPKFFAKNSVNVTLCQHYPDALRDFTLTEEYLVARSHPVGIIVKLRPGGRTSPANYHALRGHSIIIPQDPKPVLQILPSHALDFTEIIKVIWMGKGYPCHWPCIVPYLIHIVFQLMYSIINSIQLTPSYPTLSQGTACLIS